MRKFARTYLELSAQAVRKLPWGHIVVLIEQIKDPIARKYHAHSVQKKCNCTQYSHDANRTRFIPELDQKARDHVTS